MEDALERLLCIRGARIEDVASLCVEHLDQSILEEFIKESCRDKLRKLVIVYRTSSVSAKKYKSWSALCDLDLFSLDELTRLLRGHRLVRPHRRMNMEEREYFLSIYKKENLPILLTTDPQARLYDFKDGDLIRIERKRAPYFRIVVNPNISSCRDK